MLKNKTTANKNLPLISNIVHHKNNLPV